MSRPGRPDCLEEIQRVGRVDRYFSLLERRLYEAAASNVAALPNIKLDIFNP